MSASRSQKDEPDFSLIVPCYNEEDVIQYTIPKLIESFEKRGIENVENIGSVEGAVITKIFPYTGGQFPMAPHHIKYQPFLLFFIF